MLLPDLSGFPAGREKPAQLKDIRLMRKERNGGGEGANEIYNKWVKFLIYEGK